MGNDDAAEVIRRAERIVLAARHLQERSVLRRMAGTRGLARARLEPRSEVIQLVTYDGEHLGHVRREGAGPDERWVAVRKDQARRVGVYAYAGTAASAIARSCGKIAGASG